MAENINKATADTYGPPDQPTCGFGPNTDTDEIVFDIGNAPVYFQVWRYVHNGLKAELDNQTEILRTSSLGNTLRGVAGVRFRSAVAGTPAQIVAARFLKADAALSPGTPFTGALSSSGGLTPGVASMNFQHNSAAVGTETTLDFEDAAPITFGVTDDAANGRVKVTASFGGVPLQIFSSVLAAPAASIAINNLAALITTAGGSSSGLATLKVFVVGRTTAATVLGQLALQVNADTGANYDDENYYVNGTTLSALENLAGQTSMSIGALPGASATANLPGFNEITIGGWNGATFHKVAVCTWGASSDTTAAGQYIGHAVGKWRSSAALTSLLLFPRAGNFGTGTTCYVYAM